MRLFEKISDRPEHQWSWFAGTLIGSMIPVLLRLLISLDCNINSFDIKDVLFSGIAMNLSCLTLVSNNRVEAREPLIFVLALLIMFISAFLGICFYEESVVERNPLHNLKVLSIALVCFSIRINYRANKYVFGNLKKT